VHHRAGGFEISRNREPCRWQVSVC